MPSASNGRPYSPNALSNETGGSQVDGSLDGKFISKHEPRRFKIYLPNPSYDNLNWTFIDPRSNPSQSFSVRMSGP